MTGIQELPSTSPFPSYLGLSPRISVFIARLPRLCSGELLPKLNISKSFWFQGLIPRISHVINNLAKVHQKTELQARFHTLLLI